MDDDGSQIYISKKGVKAFDEHGNVVQRNNKHAVSNILEGPLFLLATVGFILIGSIAHFWYGAWVLFFVPEIICSTIRCFEKKDPNQFNMPMLSCFIFFFVCMVHPGYHGQYGPLWHPMWVVFLAIPIYYSIVGPFKKHNDEDDECDKKCKE